MMKLLPPRPAQLVPLVLLLAATVSTARTSVPQSETASDQAPSEAKPGDATPFFTDVMEVDVVNVDVFVTDKEGRPVVDLSESDFDVFEDGKPVVVTNFRTVRPKTQSERLAERNSIPASDVDAERPWTQSTAVDPASSLHLILYIDNNFIRSNNRLRVLHDLRQLINSVERNTQIMVVSHGQGQKVNQPFTTDIERVVEALLALEKIPVAGNDSQNQFLDLLSEIESRYTQKHIVEAHVYSYAQQLKQKVERGIEDLKELVDTLAGMPGRKALVYASDSLPLTPAEELFQALQIRYQDLSSLNGIMEFHATRDFEILTQVANTAGVTFYTLHAAGLEAPLGASAEISGSGIDGLRPTVDSVRTANFQGSGRVMAAATGGLALLNTNDFTKGLGQMVQDFENYYSIGYRPRHGHDDRYHDIEVKLKRKGLDVRHRQGYRDRSFTYRMQDSVVTALQHGTENNPFGIEVYAEPISESSDDDMVVVPFAVTIPIDKLVLVPRQGHHQGRVKLFLSVRDAKGSNSPVQTVEVPIEIDDASMEAALTSDWTQRVQLRVRPGRGLIGVGVWDEFGHTASILRRRFDTGSR